MRKADMPLFALESGDPITDFDIVAFSVGYEMAFPAILNMLDLAGIPLHASERTGLSPLVIAGGTDVLIKVREGKLAGCSLVSIHGLGEELSGVTQASGGDIEIGPLTTFRGVASDPVIRRCIPVLGEAVDQAGGPQLRAAGTIGGNVCNGITSADSASTLMALGAVLRVRSPRGEREVPIALWYKGVG